MRKTVTIFGLEIAKRGTINGNKEEAETKIKASEKKFKTAVVTGSSTTAAAAITAVVLGMLNKNKKNQIEQITAANKTTEKTVITYIPLLNKPKEWDKAFTNCFSVNEKNEMVPVKGVEKEGAVVAPEFTTGKYFVKKEELIAVAAE